MKTELEKIICLLKEIESHLRIGFNRPMRKEDAKKLEELTKDSRIEWERKRLLED